MKNSDAIFKFFWTFHSKMHITFFKIVDDFDITHKTC